MFEPTSRYYNIETATRETTDENGETHAVAYKRRRFLPPAGSLTVLAEHTVLQGERLDIITARYIGDPQAFWRVADANDAMNPDDLTSEPGASLKIPVPQFQ
jgi:hypothetical protein